MGSAGCVPTLSSGSAGSTGASEGWAVSGVPLATLWSCDSTYSLRESRSRFPLYWSICPDKATQQHGQVSVLECLSHSLSPPTPMAHVNPPHMRDLPMVVWAVRGLCAQIEMGEHRLGTEGLALVRELYSFFLLQSYESQKPGCRLRSLRS